jgi:hypothetical protein
VPKVSLMSACPKSLGERCTLGSLKKTSNKPAYPAASRLHPPEAHVQWEVQILLLSGVSPHLR